MKNTIILFFWLALCLNSFAQSEVVYNFDGLEGREPLGTLVSYGNHLYGMTSSGGSDGGGTIFKIKPDGKEFETLFNFSANDGVGDNCSIIIIKNAIYGMKSQGGNFSDHGTVFKINLDGTNFTKIKDFEGDFAGQDVNGSQPNGGLVTDGTFLYGMTSKGGVKGGGVIFKIKLDGTGFVKLLDFVGENGLHPEGSLLYDGGILYGMTSLGGKNNSGTIFKIITDGKGYSKLFDFARETGSGISPHGTLISDGVYLYGMTQDGGTNKIMEQGGTIFKIKPDGTGYVKLHEFGIYPDGKYPLGSLLLIGKVLYGMTSNGGLNNSNGVMFKINCDGTGYTKLLDFEGKNGKRPLGSLMLESNFLYGVTSGGGKNNLGILFRYNIANGQTSTSESAEPKSAIQNTIIASYHQSFWSPEDEHPSVIFKSDDGKWLYFYLNENLFKDITFLIESDGEEKTNKSNVGKKFTLTYMPKNNVQGILGEIAMYKENQTEISTSTKPKIGLVLNDIDDLYMKEKKLSNKDGAITEKVVQGGAGAESGILVGDVFLSIDNLKINGAQNMVNKIQSYKPGDKITILILRNGTQISKVVTLK